MARSLAVFSKVASLHIDGKQHAGGGTIATGAVARTGAKPYYI